MEAIIQKVDDFVITGKGISRNWEKADWMILTALGHGALTYRTRAKALWSSSGIYFFFDCEDTLISCTKMKDFEELYLEDVIEIFLWPDENQYVYFEYQISPLGYELPLMVANNNGRFHGWLPFKYTNERRALFRTSVSGGEKKAKAEITGWQAELFIPFELLVGLRNQPPEPGVFWRVNFCRLDFDSSPKTQWSWAVDNMIDNFHSIHDFGRFIFTSREYK
ncbi:MAG: carbohydrate-binding family 9-like protein [Spirochaetales bacterium]|nr:carbohydrate-binding family 9-like protein [Spirochaetales bacterium]